MRSGVMAVQRDSLSEQRRFLAINFRVGTRENGYLIGPALVSTSDYAQFHFWDEPGAAEFDADDYEIVKLYPRGLTYDEAARQFSTDFPPAFIGPQSTGWVAVGAALGLVDRPHASACLVVAA
jgi:hypothetical protein